MNDNKLPRAIDLEVFGDPRPVDGLPIMPTSIRINGVELMLPLNAKTLIHPLNDSPELKKANLAKATVTFCVRSVFVGNGPMRAYEAAKMDSPRAADLEFYDGPFAKSADCQPGEIPDWVPHKSLVTRLNGVSVLTEGPVVLNGLGDFHECLTATATFFLRTLSVHA